MLIALVFVTHDVVEPPETLEKGPRLSGLELSDGLNQTSVFKCLIMQLSKFRFK